jgi:hypothetical protein
MKKEFIIFIFLTLISIILPINAKAADLKLTCNYDFYPSYFDEGDDGIPVSLKLYSDDSLEFNYSDKTVSLPSTSTFPLDKSITSNRWSFDFNFAETFISKAHPSGSYKCPNLSLGTEQGSWDEIFVVDNTNDSFTLTKEILASGTTTVKETQKCTYYIKERLAEGLPITKASSDNNITVILAMDSADKKYFYVQGTRSNDITSSVNGEVKIPVYKNTISGIKYYDNVRFVIKSVYTSTLFKQANSAQLNNHTFECPDTLYVIRDSGLDIAESNYYSYYISTTKDNRKEADLFYATKTGKIGDSSGYGDDKVTDQITGEPIDCSTFVDEGVNLISEIFNIIMIAAPILVIVLGSLDFAKASLAQDENALKKAGTNFGKRLIAAVLLFLLPLIINIILGLAFDAGVFGDNEVPEVCLEEEE